MKPFRVVEDALQDIARVADYMEHQRRGYGETFSDTVAATIEPIRRTPGVFKVFQVQYRRCLMNRFSYYVYFRNQPDMIEIMRIIHTRRDQESAYIQKPKPKKPRNRTGS